jgi:hypothetical protein
MDFKCITLKVAGERENYPKLDKKGRKKLERLN